MVLSDEPTQIQPTVPAPPGAGPGLQPHEPSPGGPGQTPPPPLPPTGGGGDGGNGWDGGPGDDPRDRRTLWLAIAGAAVILLLVFIAISSGNDDETVATATPTPVVTAAATATPKPTATAPTTPTASEANPAPTPTTPAGNESSSGGVAVEGGSEAAGEDIPALADGAVVKFKAKQGDTVKFTVASATADEVHVHGYDVTYPIGAGQTRTISFPAEIAGIFEIEFEGSGTQIGELTVEP